MSARDSFPKVRVVHRVQICPEETMSPHAMAFTLQIRAGSPNNHNTQQRTETAMALGDQ